MYNLTEKLKEIQAATEMSEYKLAKAIGISRSTARNYLLGKADSRYASQDIVSKVQSYMGSKAYKLAKKVKV